jgi:hypothetical protein
MTSLMTRVEMVLVGLLLLVLTGLATAPLGAHGWYRP